MKKIGFLLIAMIFIGSGCIYANTEPITTKKLTNQITKILLSKEIPDEIKGSVAELRLAIDSFGEIQVLSINTTDRNLENYLMEAVHNNLVNKGTFKPGKVYRIPILVSADNEE
ncbi:hypothetical protein [Maribacter polysaccharolyticus]|uniref:hypothetical protein n=1 Tax=Maribacter polysaccharolyticus TaxID=3020831 RepID=UPI00237FCEFD|nr:hypothetical protein [Maribacter polysaccharolyticus]MDE3742582.1 hypothetical protein [Maribacter polysaccharolyticus]